MIWLGHNKNKVFALTVFTVVFMGLIFWSWLKLKPWGDNINVIKTNFNFDSVSSTKAELKNSWEMSKIQIDNLSQALKRQQQEEEILNETKKYLNNLTSTTASTTLSTSTVE